MTTINLLITGGAHFKKVRQAFRSAFGTDKGLKISRELILVRAIRISFREMSFLRSERFKYCAYVLLNLLTVGDWSFSHCQLELGKSK